MIFLVHAMKTKQLTNYQTTKDICGLIILQSHQTCGEAGKRFRPRVTAPRIQTMYLQTSRGGTHTGPVLIKLVHPTDVQS